VLVSKNSEETVLLDHIVVIAQAKPDYKPTSSIMCLRLGDTVPDFKMRNQDGRAIHLDQFRGKALLVTFIYTRCPLPNFCPLVYAQFCCDQRELAVRSGALRENALLRELRSGTRHAGTAAAYGAEYIGSDARNAFAHWDFAVPTKPELLEMAKFFDVGISPGAGRHHHAHAVNNLDRPARQGGAVLSGQRVDPATGGWGCKEIGGQRGEKQPLASSFVVLKPYLCGCQIRRRMGARSQRLGNGG
jgi:hypothetical protein